MIPKPPINDYGSYNQEAVQSGYRTHFNSPVFYRNTCIYCGNRYGERIDNCKTCGASMIYIHNFKKRIIPYVPKKNRFRIENETVNNNNLFYLLFFLFLIFFITINILLK